MSDFRSTRRQFVQSVAAAGLLGPAVVSSARAASGPNDRINVGLIGVGTMGRGHLRKLLGQKDVQVVSVCDVVVERRDDAKKIVEEHYAKQNDLGTYSGCAMFNDLREVLGRKDIDAVVVATPDHWHAAASILAARAGKDIYCEKPLTHSIAEGRRIVETVRSNKVIFQTGSQQRSEFGGLFRKAVEHIRNGAIGRVHTVHVGVGGPPVVCDLPEQEIPAGTDWNLWCGPGPLRPYNEVLCPKGVHKHFPAWRQYKEYGGGAMADIGAHHFDIAEWALDMDGSGPVLIEPPAGDATTGLKFVFSNGVEMFHGGPSGCTFEGTTGTIYVDRGKLTSTPETILQAELGPDAWRCHPSTDHIRNWLDCIRSRQQPICTAEIGNRSAAICHLANIGYELRRTLRWSPSQERFLDDEAANALLDRTPREPWNV